MIEKTYYCTYKNHTGAIVIEPVVASSPNAAVRIIMLKHPLAEIIEQPTENNPTLDNSASQKMNSLPIGNKVIIFALSGVCVALVGLVALLLLKTNGVVVTSTEEKFESKVEELSEDDYSDAYRRLVSIRTDDMSGSGFKLRTNEGVYLYTCYHCINQAKEIIAKDVHGKRLVLGDLEFCYERDLVRFALPEETEGFELAMSKDIAVSVPVVAYGDTSGRGVMTQNKGKILAVGTHKIEIDAAVLSGNSGGPVLDGHGRVVGVISSGSIENTIWAKDTRYEKVRKFAERIDGGEWVPVSYDEFRAVYALVWDIHLATLELKEFSSLTADIKFAQRIERPLNNASLYIGDDDLSSRIQAIYRTWDEMVDVEKERLKLWDETNGKVGTRIQENCYYEIVKRRNLLERQSTANLPLQALKYSVQMLESLDVLYLKNSRKSLIDEIQKELIPMFEKEIGFADRLDKEAQDVYMRNFNRAK